MDRYLKALEDISDVFNLHFVDGIKLQQIGEIIDRLNNN